MTRIPILAGGAVLAALVLCGGGVAVASALTSHDDSHVLHISGVTTAEAGDDNGADVSGHHDGVTVVTPPDPTRIDDDANDATENEVGDDNGVEAGDDNGGGTSSGSGDSDSGSSSGTSGSDSSHSGSGSSGSDDGGSSGGQGDGGHDGADG